MHFLHNTAVAYTAVFIHGLSFAKLSGLFSQHTDANTLELNI